MIRLFFIIGVLFYSCSNEPKRIDNYSIVINELVKNELKDIDVIVLETKPVMQGDTLDVDPKIGDALLNFFAQTNKIKQEDIEFIHQQLDSSCSIVLDSTHIVTKTIHKVQLDRLFESMGLDSTLSYLNKKKNIRSIATFSTPLFSKDKTKILFFVDIWRNPTNGTGYFFIVSKENNKWRVVEHGGTYKS